MHLLLRNCEIVPILGIWPLTRSLHNTWKRYLQPLKEGVLRCAEHTNRQTGGHYDSMTKSALCATSVKIYFVKDKVISRVSSIEALHLVGIVCPIKNFSKKKKNATKFTQSSKCVLNPSSPNCFILH